MIIRIVFLAACVSEFAMIAMALACKPKLLHRRCEPTTALDVTVQAEILELIKLLQDEEAMSVVFITHDMWRSSPRSLIASSRMWKGEKVEE